MKTVSTFNAAATGHDAAANSGVLVAAQQPLVLSFLPAATPAAPSLLMLHGWGASSAVWRDCQQGLQQHFNLYLLDLPGHGANANAEFDSADEFVDTFAAQHLAALPEKFALLGWSLGGLLASKFAQRYQARVSSLVTIATNQSFVAHEQWPSAMAVDVFEDFCAGFDKSSSEQTLADELSRFYALQVSGLPQQRKHLRTLKQLLANTRFGMAGLNKSLAWLQDNDLAQCWRGLSIPVLHQYGHCDALLPVDAGAAIASKFSDFQVRIFAGSAHLPFISEREHWLATTVAFIAANANKPGIDKRAIAQSFSNAAKAYDNVAIFQQNTGNRLLTHLPIGAAQRVLDLGAGTGYFSSLLRHRYPVADIIELDISASMLSQGQLRSRACNSEVVQLQADFEALPFKLGSFDLIYSNLAIQWCHKPLTLFENIFNSLTDHGVAVLTTLVDGSLRELKQAWSAVDAAVHVNRFDLESTLKNSVEQAGLTIEYWSVEETTECFDELAELVRSVKGVGAHNMNSDRPKGLMGKQRYRKFVSAYQAQKNQHGQLPLSYRVLYTVLRKRT